jgi:hypothetical protein
MLPDCDGCYQPIEGKPFDPGHNYGCGFSRRPAPLCHEQFCSEACFSDSNELREQHAIATFYGG